MRRVASIFAVILGCVGCDAPVVLAVDLKTDFAVAIEVHRAVVFLDGEAVAERELPIDGDYRAGARLVDAETASGSHRVAVVLEDAAGEEVVRREMIVRADADRVVTFLITRSCRDVACPPSDDPARTTCVGGRCSAPECSPDTPEACPAPECVADGDCPSSGGCAQPACVEGSCVQLGDDDLCRPARYCAGAEGCADRPERVRCVWPADPAALQLGAPEPIGGAPEDLTSWLTADHLALYVSRHDYANPDFVVYRRPDPGAPFGAGEPVDALNTPGEERRFEIGPDGLWAVLCGDRGVTPDSDVFLGARENLDAPWQWERADALSTVGVNDLGCHITRDGLELWLHQEGAVLHSRRPSLDASFGPPEPVPGPTFIAEDGSASLTDDGLTVVFHTVRGGTKDVYYAVRQTRDEPFGEPQPVPGLSTAADEWVPFVRGDGCELFYAVGPYREGQLYRLPLSP